MKRTTALQLINDISQKLNKSERKRLAAFLAHVSEKIYRRGAQQAYCMNHKGLIKKEIFKDNLTKWRFSANTKKATGLDGFNTSSEERFEMEFPEARWLRPRESKEKPKPPT